MYINPKYLLLFFDAVHFAIWVTVLNTSLSRRFRLSVTVVSEVLWTFVYLVLVHSFARLSYVGNVIYILQFYIITFILFKDTPCRIIFTVSSIFACMVLNELIILQFLMPEDYQLWRTGLLSTRQILLVMIPYIASESFIFTMLTLLLNKIRMKLDLKDYMLFAFFPITQFMLLFGWVDSLSELMDDTRIFYFLLITLLTIASDVGLFFAIKKVSLESGLKAENKILTEQILIQEKHYSDLTAQYENIRLMRHDISNHVLAMRSLLESGQIGQAEKYLAELDSAPLMNGLGLCKNPVIDAFLYSRISRAGERGIEIKASVILPDELKVSNLDLVRCLGNMLDNAEEACADTNGASVDLECSFSRGFVVIRTKNPCSQLSNHRAQRIAHLDRGLGTRVLNSIAEKYDGSFKLSRIDNMCTAELLLNTGVENAENSHM